MAEALTLSVAVPFAALGVYALVSPKEIPALFGSAADTPDARNEVRAVYGGFGVAIAAALVYAVLSSNGELADGIRVTVAAAMGGMAAGRLIAWVIERPRAFFPTGLFFVVELALAGALVAAA